MNISEVLAAIDLAVDDLASTASGHTWALSDAELREFVTLAHAVQGKLQSVFLTGVVELDSRPGAVPGAPADRQAVTFLREGLRRPGAKQEVETAHALKTGGDFPMLSTALAAGQISREHVDALLPTLRKLPGHLLDDQGRAEVDRFLTETSREFRPQQAEKLARYLLGVLDPDGSDTYDPNAVDRRELSLTREAGGMVLIRGALDPEAGAAVMAACERFGAPQPSRTLPAEDGAVVTLVDDRSKRQRNADALAIAAKIALSDGGGDISRPNVVVYTTIEGPVAESEQTGPVEKPWLARMLCDAVLHRVTRSPSAGKLDLGAAVRTVSQVQRRALIARDRTCVIPGCHIPGSWSEAHHVRWFSKGGATDLENLAMVCGRHHAAIHAGTWSLEMRDGVPWARPPNWLDPHRRLIRNTYPDRRDEAVQLGLSLGPPGTETT